MPGHVRRHHAIGEPTDELPTRAEEAIGSTAAWPPNAKGTAIIDFIIPAVNLVNLAIASLYFRSNAVTRDGWRWIVDAHREGRRYVVHSDELLSAFFELERVTIGQ